MDQAPDFSIGYVSPGIVRCGENGMTDYCLIYREPGVELYFHCVGKRSPEGNTTYHAAMPKEAYRSPGVYERTRMIIDRLSAFVQSDFRVRLHKETTFDASSSRAAQPDEVMFDYVDSMVVPIAAYRYSTGAPYTGHALGSVGAADWAGPFVDGVPHGQFRLIWGDKKVSFLLFERGARVHQTAEQEESGYEA